MTIGIPSDAELWEIVAAIQLCQSMGITEYAARYNGSQDALGMFDLAGLMGMSDEDGLAVPLETAKAYRAVNSSSEPYPAVLGRTSGLTPGIIRPPKFPNAKIEPSLSGGIVVCPFEINDAFRLPWQVWKELIRHARTYGLSVALLGRPGQRTDYATFTEGQILSSLPIEEKMAALASARLVIGVPNEWTWIASAWDKKIAIMQPDDIPNERWFGFPTAPYTLGRVLFTRSQLGVPVLLAGLRRIIEAL